MRMTKRILVAGVALSTLALAGCLSSPSGSSDGDSTADSGDTAEVGSLVGKQQLGVGFNQDVNHPQAQAILEASDAIYNATDGEYSLQLFPDAQLGDQAAMIEQMQSGSLQFTIVASPQLEAFEPQFSVINLPYLFDSPEQQIELINDDSVVGDLYDALEEDDIKIVAGYHAGVRSMYTIDGPVETPADLQGKKIRVIPSDTNLRMIELLGGVGTPMASGETYGALQSGVIDGAENNEITYNDQSHAEVAKFYSYTNHLMLPDYLLADANFWNGLDADAQSALEEAFATSVDTEYSLWTESTNRAIEDAKSKGATFSEPDIEPFKEAVLPLHEEVIETDLQQSVYDAITGS